MKCVKNGLSCSVNGSWLSISRFEMEVPSFFEKHVAKVKRENGKVTNHDAEGAKDGLLCQ